MTAARPVPCSAGIGLRLPHLTEIAQARPAAAWFEVHAENFLANPHAAELLGAIAAHYPISVHTVGVSIGSAGGIDRQHLSRVRALVDQFEPALMSGHLAWSTHDGEFLNDLLPLPYDDETLALLVRHVGEVQDGLGHAYLVENPSSYFGFAQSTMTEVEFLTELCARSGCRLLCDVSNVYLSAHNMGFDPYRYIDGLPVAAIGELHLGGFTVEPDEGDPNSIVLVDTHAARITDPVWDLYAHALRRFGPTPTMIEWDNDIPPVATLLAEAARADAVAAAALSEAVPAKVRADAR